MQPAVESSPLKRLCTFLLGLATFGLFGLLAMCANVVNGSAEDPVYQAAAAERAEKVKAALEAQATKLTAAPIDTAIALGNLSNAKAAASTKPLPGTPAFDEWMAKQMAASEPAEPTEPGEPTEPTEPGEPTEPETVAATELTVHSEPGGVMKFKEKTLTAKAGLIRITFANTDILPHNMLVLAPGTKDSVGALADALIADPNALAMHYIPQSEDILGHTDLLQPTQKGTFEVSISEPGDYPYICTFPGHWRLMNGVLTVTP